MKGYVNDGEQKPDDPAFDLDYQTERSILRAYWGGFTDPHTLIREYRVSAGTLKGAQDVLTTQAIGLVNSRYSLLYLNIIKFSPFQMATKLF